MISMTPMDEDAPGTPEPTQAPVRSLRELIDRLTGANLPEIAEGESTLLEPLHYPFFALVGQYEMKLALLLSLINPGLGGVLLMGPRGTGKTTAVRGLLDLLPTIERSTCYYGCLPQDIETGGIDAICPDCARKYAEGHSLTNQEQSRLVELPLNARLDDVVGGVDERVLLHDRLRLRRGILANADLNLLYVDEINLLNTEIVDSILDAAAQGSYTVRRGPVSASYRSRFTLIGTMNPEEGSLRPQILDRFGLRVVVRGLQDAAERLEVYRRVQAFRKNPRQFIQEFASATLTAKADILSARARLPDTSLPAAVAAAGLHLIQSLQIDSARAEIALFEAARAHAAADNRPEANLDDLRTIAPLCLRMRQSHFMSQFLLDQASEDEKLSQFIGKF